MNAPQPLAPAPNGPHIAIIGAGASGVIMAAHLLSNTRAGFRVSLIEAQGSSGRKLGRGVAYSTESPDHVLNTRASNMSAFPDDPSHFQRWLDMQGLQEKDTQFVRRSTYGAYLGRLLQPWLGIEPAERLRLIPQEVLALDDLGGNVVLTLSGGGQLLADYAILATGHVIARDSAGGAIAGAWDVPAPIAADAPVVIIGSGLSMVDNALTLLASGHRGQIISLSRRGLLPRGHGPVDPAQIATADIPWGKPLSQVLRWLRGRVAARTAAGSTWRDEVDGLRPHAAQMWRNLPIPARARFLRHGAPWWDVHRHRIPPDSETVIEAAISSGQLRIEKGHFLSATARPDGQIEARYRRDINAPETRIIAARVIDCRGIRRDAGKNAGPLVQHLLASGQARLDPLRLGLDVAAQTHIVSADGQRSPRLMAIGPASRATFWEITAMPDIRVQAARLAERLAQTAYALQ